MASGERIGRAVVIVSGGAAVSPFTTPTEACANGLAAGNTDTALREALLAAGFAVFTSPARIGAGQVTEDIGWQGFSGAPGPLPAELTVNAVGGIDDAGANLARFLGYLEESYGVTEVDLVAHSMGGLFSRAAIKRLKDDGSLLRIRTLTTLGTPWTGGFTADYATGELPLEACGGDALCERIMTSFAEMASDDSEGASEQVTREYLEGPGGWNERQGEALAGIPVRLIAGTAFTQDGGDPRVWPHDGLVTPGSALAVGVSERVLPAREMLTFADTHSIYFADLAGLPWERALTWDPAVHAAVIEGIREPSVMGATAMTAPTDDSRSDDGA
jgi:pimeloyl-ACP methyl ester carboxylesterase